MRQLDGITEEENMEEYVNKEGGGAAGESEAPVFLKHLLTPVLLLDDVLM